MTVRAFVQTFLAFAAFIFLTCACASERPEGPKDAPGDELMICCCFGEYSVAEKFLLRVKEAVPGSAVRIGAKRVGDGSERLVFEVYASHPDLTPEQLAARLAGYSCPSAR